ncbi:MAG: glycoside hydrolase family 5 protein [Ruminococcus sp.]|nr:glycoside hydrolase family 5 protein [Ruminococcus sp.]
MTLKRIVALTLSAVMCLGCLTACDGSDGKDEKIKKIRDISAKELVSEIKIGWNLGNTLDADAKDGLAAEVSWGNPTTRKEMFTFVKEQGFNLVRVPVSWNKHMDENYKVDAKWMKRVREVVDYGIDQGMFVILDTHHEDWYYPTEENKEDDKKQLKALWEQIAEEFKGYDEHLIFEGLNEPRLRDTSLEWTAGTPAAREIINEYEKVFYDTVRKSGGNNPKRHLLLTGYCASNVASALQAIEIPKDDNKIIVSVHEYLPFDFANNENGTTEYNPDSDNPIFNSLFMNLESLFTSIDIPVIITECGALAKMTEDGGYNVDERIECMQYLFTCAKEAGIPCVLWDNGSFLGNNVEHFGLMNRDNPPSWREPELIEAIMDVVNGKTEAKKE